MNSQAVINRLASSQAGAVSGSQLAGLGVTRHMIARKVRHRSLTPVGRGVYLVAGVPDSFAQRCWVTSLAFPNGALSRFTAADLHGLDRLEPDERRSHRVEAVVAPSQWARWTPGEVRRSNHLPSTHIVEHRGLRITSIDRTLCDLAVCLPTRRYRAVIVDALTTRRTSTTTLGAVHEELSARGRNGTEARRRVLDPLLTSDPARSFAELEFVQVLETHDLAGFTEQFRPPWFDGLRGRVDFADPVARLIVEIDGAAWHASAERQQEDRRRERQARSHGWSVIRFTLDDITLRAAAVAADIRRMQDLGRQAA